MKVGVLTTGYPRFEGDLAGHFVHAGCRALHARGAEVCVVAPHADGVPLREDRDGVHVERFRYLPSSWERVAYGSGTPANLRRSPWVLLGLPFYTVAFWRAARRLARGSDVIHAHWIPTGLLALTTAGPRSHRPAVIVSVWGSDIAALRHRVWGSRVARRLGSADAVVAVSEAMRRELVQRGVPDDKTHVIRSAAVIPPTPREDRGALRSALGLPPDRTIALFLGRLSPVKGPGFLLEALGRLKDSVPSLDAVFVGDGQMRAEMEATARREGLGDRVRFLGSILHDEVGRWLKLADLLVLPSLSEGMPHAVLEAISFGLPVVASAVGGVSEVVIHGESGTLVAPGDATALAEAIQGLVEDPDRRRRFGERALQLAAERRLGDSGSELFDLYRAVLRR